MLDFYLASESIILTFHNLIDSDVDPGTIGLGNEFRYVIIPWGTTAKKVADSPDMSNYYEVMEYYEIDP